MIISLDPSINSCGYAVFINDNLHSFGVIHPDKTFCSDWIDKANSIVLKLDSLLLEYKEDLTKVVFEMPESWMSAKGQIAKDSGALLKLAFICGMIQGRFINHAYEVSARIWKGQLPKSATISMIKDKFPMLKNVDLKDHEADAIAIGLWYIKIRKYTICNVVQHAIEEDPAHD